MIEVIKAGLFSTIQDSGRWGYQAYGMPVAGAMDRYAYQTANLLVGNDDGEAALEMTIRGGTFRFSVATRIALCGADMDASLDGEKVTNWSSLLAPPGSELVCQYAASGCRTYLAVHGGLDVPLVLGSRSTYTRAKVGGLNGQPLTDACQLLTFPGMPQETATYILPRMLVPDYPSEVTLRVLLGPQDDLFTPAGIDTFFAGTYTVTVDADRMGYRLDGPQVAHAGNPDIVSDALSQGAIQIPGHGMPIVMMADRQTTGGYPKIGTVIGPDLYRLAQTKPGDRVRFRQCSDAEAVTALQQEQQGYRVLSECLAALERRPTDRRYLARVNGHLFHFQYAKGDE